MKSTSPEVQSRCSLKLKYLYKILMSAFETHCLPRLHSGNILEPWWKLPTTLFSTSVQPQARFCYFFLALDQEGDIYLFGILVSILNSLIISWYTEHAHINTPFPFLDVCQKNNCSSPMSLICNKFLSFERSSPECSSLCLFHLPLDDKLYDLISMINSTI